MLSSSCMSDISLQHPKQRIGCSTRRTRQNIPHSCCFAALSASRTVTLAYLRVPHVHLSLHTNTCLLVFPLTQSTAQSMETAAETWWQVGIEPTSLVPSAQTQTKEEGKKKANRRASPPPVLRFSLPYSHSIAVAESQPQEMRERGPKGSQETHRPLASLHARRAGSFCCSDLASTPHSDSAPHRHLLAISPTNC